MWRLFLGAFFVILVALAGCGGGIEWFPENSSGINNPDAFTFTAVTCVTTSKQVESNEITLSGLTGQATIKVEGGQYGIKDTAANPAVFNWSSDNGSGTVANGAVIKVRHTSAALTSLSGVTITVLTIGARSATFWSDTGPYLRTSNQTPSVCE